MKTQLHLTKYRVIQVGGVVVMLIAAAFGPTAMDPASGAVRVTKRGPLIASTRSTCDKPTPIAQVEPDSTIPEITLRGTLQLRDPGIDERTKASPSAWLLTNGSSVPFLEAKLGDSIKLDRTFDRPVVIQMCVQGGNGSESATLTFRAELRTPDGTNWAGYYALGLAADPIPFTAVTAEWRVPKLQGNCALRGLSVNATWVGIGGWFGAPAAIAQIGTVSGCSLDVSHTYQPGYRVTYQMFENLPGDKAAYPELPRVKPHDLVRATVLYEGKGQFTLKLDNLTDRQPTLVLQHQRFRKHDGSAKDVRASAGCILERGSTDLLDPPPFESVSVEDCRVTDDSPSTSGWPGVGVGPQVGVANGRQTNTGPLDDAATNFQISYTG